MDSNNHFSEAQGGTNQVNKRIHMTVSE